MSLMHSRRKSRSRRFAESAFKQEGHCLMSENKKVISQHVVVKKTIMVDSKYLDNIF